MTRATFVARFGAIGLKLCDQAWAVSGCNQRANAGNGSKNLLLIATEETPLQIVGASAH